MPRKTLAPETFNTSYDSRYSREAGVAIGRARGEIVASAEKTALPDRFIAEKHAHTPAMIIHDSETGRSASVPLYAYEGVRDALNSLFGPPKPTLPTLFENLGLPLECTFGGMSARAGWSPYIKECPCFILDTHESDAGELGIGRIEMRDDGMFHLLSPTGHLGTFGSIEDALQAAENELCPPPYSGNDW